MRLVAPKEAEPETRVALVPAGAKRLVELGAEVFVERGAGGPAAYTDAAYEEAGATLFEGTEALAEADIVVRVRPPSEAALRALAPNTLHISHLDPFNQKPLLDAGAEAEVSLVAMEMVPRTTLAQKMDALSSQMNLAGYFAVIHAADRLGKILPMMMTPAGTLSPARVFVIGVGVAGLQAIATAKRLGARVEAFDTRPVVEEQVKSLGAKFVKIDLGDTGQTDQGYAKELSPEQIALQQEGMAKVCGNSDIVITTAKLFGRPAPKIVTADMVARMKPGSVVVDLAAASGGNVEGTVLGEEVTSDNGVKIIGHGTLEGFVPHAASQMYSANIVAYLEHFWDAESSAFQWRLDDEILAATLLTHGGRIVHERFAPAAEDGPAATAAG